MSEQVGISPHDNKDVSIYQKQHLQIGAHTKNLRHSEKVILIMKHITIILHLRHQSSCSSGLTIKPAAQCKLDSPNKCAVHIIFKLCPILEIKTFRLLNIS